MMRHSLRAVASCAAGFFLICAGCAREYQVAERDYTAAVALSKPPGDRRPFALAAVPLDEGVAARPVYLRAANITLKTEPYARGVLPPQLRVSAPNSRSMRETGRVLLVMGLLHLAAVAGVITYDFWPTQCLRDFTCQRGIPASAIYGPPLAVFAVGLTIPGVVLTVKGYRYPSEVSPGQPGIRYLGAAQSP